MAVSADILDGGGAGKAGDLGKSFDAGEAAITSVSDDGVPFGAAISSESGSSLRGAGCGSAGIVGCSGARGVRYCDAGNVVADDNTGPACVVGDGIGATAENEDGKAAFACEIESLRDVVNGFNINKIAGWAAKAHGGKFG